MELIMLGTGNAMVTRCYNTCFVLSSGEEYFLVDAGGGNGIFKQLEQAGVPFTGIREMFVTHAHTDHILGAIWVIRKIATLMSNDKYRGNFIVYGHNEVIDALRTFCRLTLPGKILKYIDERIFWGEVKDGTRKEILGLPICFFDILSTKMKQFGFRVLYPMDKCWFVWETNLIMRSVRNMSNRPTGYWPKLFVCIATGKFFHLMKNITVLLWMPVVWPKLWG